MFLRRAQVTLLALSLSACSSDWIADQLTRLPERPSARPSTRAQVLPAREPGPSPSASSPAIQIGGGVKIEQRDVDADINCPGVGTHCEIKNITQLLPPETQTDPLSGQPTASPSHQPSTQPSPRPASPSPTALPSPVLPEPSFGPEPTPTPEPTPAAGALGPVTVASFAQEGWQHKILRDGAYVGILTPDSAGKLSLYRSKDSGQTFSPVSLNASLKGDFAFGKDPGGAWLIVWQSDDDRLYLLRSSNRGQSWGAPIRLLAGFEADWLDQPHFVTVSGQTWLVFQARRLGLTEVYLTHFDTSFSFSEPARVTTDTLQNDQPQVAISSEGVYVAWHAEGRLMLSASHDDGANFAEATQVADGLESVQPTYKLLSQGKRLYLAYSQWVRQPKGEMSYDVLLARRLREGLGFEYVPISDDQSHAQESPDLMIDAEGSLHALWSDNRINRSFGTLAYARSRDGGESFGPTRLLSETGAYSHGAIANYPADPDQIYINTIYHNEANGVRDFHFYRLIP